MLFLAKRLALAALAPVVAFAALELMLRISGFGTPSSLYLLATWNGSNVATENPAFTRKYFGRGLERAPWPAAFPVPKPQDEFRVFLLGESAALGDPIPEFGLARMLEVLLQEAMPHRRVRVINSAITAINSHVIREIAGEASGLEPDAVVIYMGNNEVVGPFGPGTVFTLATGSARAIRAITWVRGTRTAQLTEAILAKTIPSARRSWRGMEMFLDRQVAPDDPRLAVTRRRFEKNLEAICTMFLRNDVPVALSTVAVNLRDCAPLASPPPDHTANRFFLEARDLEARGMVAEAAVAYRAAMEADTLRFRADTAINDAIRRVAARHAGRGVTLVDAETLIEAESPNRLPDESFFYDHVHLNFHGQYFVAVQAADALLAGQNSSRRWLTREEVAARLGWTPWSEKEALGEMYARRMRPPFSDQLDRAEVERRWSERLIDYALSCREDCLNAAGEALFQSLEKRGTEDSNHWRNLAEVEIARGHLEEAAGAFGQVADRLPHHAARYRMHQAAALGAIDPERGFALIRSDEHYRRWPDDRIWSGMGDRLVAWGWARQAEPFFHKAWLINPENPAALLNLGVSRAVAGRPDEAIGMLRRAVALKPNDDIAWANLGRALYESGEKEEGIRAMEKAVNLHPENDLSRSSLAVMYFREGSLAEAREQFAAALTGAPLDPVLLADAARLAVAQEDYVQAGEWQSRAARLSPADAYSQYLAGQLLLQTERRLEAVEYLRAALRLAPGQTAWRANLIWILATHPDVRLRDPEKALALAEDFPEDGKTDWMRMDLKAAALAADGRTDEAAELLSRLNPEIIPEDFREKITSRLALYRNGLSYIADEVEFVPR